MTAGETAEVAAEYAAPWIERLARVGFAAKALLYGTVGMLAGRMALGTGGRATGARGAMSSVQDAPFGRVLLGLVAVGLVGYALWRVIQAIVDPERRGSDAKGLALRISFAARGLIHAALAISALRLAVGNPPEGDGNDAERWAARALGVTGGRSLLWMVALSIGAFGVYQLYRAFAAKLSKQLQFGKISAELGRWIIGVSRVGIAARGIVFVMVALLLAGAAFRQSPSHAGGIDDALESFSALGKWPLVAIAAGLIAYGAYELLNARYRRIRIT
ncbi:MAG: DUF1206 domain-containing protein [Gemmatimonadaceae bacterium]